MAKRKPTEARYISLRLNPATNKYDKAFLEIIESMEREKIKVKSVIVDAVLHVDGKTPEMFAEGVNLPSLMLNQMESMLDSFARHILDSIKAQGLAVVSAQLDDAQVERGRKKSSAFTKNFLSAVKDRQNEQGE